ncbi:hypothetical protein HDU67_008281, partial [Dinochytrium kinnereticum]
MVRTHAIAIATASILAVGIRHAAAIDTCNTQSMVVFDTDPFDIIGFDFNIPPPTVLNYCACAALCQSTAACSLKSPTVPNNAVTIFISDPVNLRFSGSIQSLEEIPQHRKHRVLQPVAMSQLVVISSTPPPPAVNSRIGVRGVNPNPVTSTTTSVTTTTTETSTTETTTTTTDESISTTSTGPLIGSPGAIITSSALTSTSTSSRPLSTTTAAPESTVTNSGNGNGQAATDNKGLTIGLAVAGSFVGVLVIGAMVAYGIRMSARKKESASKAGVELFSPSVGSGNGPAAAAALGVGKDLDKVVPTPQ